MSHFAVLLLKKLKHLYSIDCRFVFMTLLHDTNVKAPLHQNHFTFFNEQPLTQVSPNLHIAEFTPNDVCFLFAILEI